MNFRELKFIRPAVVYGWQIHESPYGGTSYWDGDNLMPVKVGALAERLIEQGYLERSGFHRIFATPKAKALWCRAPGCVQGIIHDDNDQEVGECDACYKGIILKEDE